MLVGPMSTTIEVKNLPELNAAISSAHVQFGCKEIDDRRDKEVSIDNNLAAVK